MLRILLISIVTFICLGSLSAQQESHYTQFMYNKLYLNPAYAGAEGYGSFVGIYRNQWMGFDGAPVSQLLSYNTPFLGKRVGFGLVLNHDKIGILNNWRGAMSYSYDLINRPNTMLRIGLQGSARYFQLDFTDPSLNIIDPNDPSILENMQSDEIYYNVGAGLYLEVHSFFFGFSVPSLIENIYGFNPDSGNPTAAERRHYYAMTGVALPVSDKVTMRTAVLGKYVKHAPVDVDINLMFDFNKRLQTGLSYRVGGDGTGDSVDFLLFGQLSRNFGLGLAYDYSLSEIRNSTSGSIEALLRLDLLGSKDNLQNPRFFY
jgi:type IX secretion system PorP/SprF family membrane protein